MAHSVCQTCRTSAKVKLPIQYVVVHFTLFMYSHNYLPIYFNNIKANEQTISNMPLIVVQ